MARLWNLILSINSVIWTLSLAYLTYATCFLFIALEWRQFVFSVALFVAVCIVEIIIAALIN